MQVFKKGYEENRILSGFDSFRSFYRFMMYLNDPWEKKSLEHFLESSTYFP